jgi:hypothetical protein
LLASPRRASLACQICGLPSRKAEAVRRNLSSVVTPNASNRRHLFINVVLDINFDSQEFGRLVLYIHCKRGRISQTIENNL